MSDVDNIAPPIQAQLLKAEMGNLSRKDMDFAASLLAQYAGRGNLSQKQWPWVTKLLKRARGEDRAPLPTTDVGSFEGVLELFRTAGAHLRHPKIRLQAEGHPVVLSVAGPASKAPGTVNVTDGGPYGSNRWYGRITPQGSWTPGRQVEGGPTQASVAALLSRLANAPAQTAAEYGKLTGSCCMCGRPLEDHRSLAVGYGPVCAKNFGLPWGAHAAPEPLEVIRSNPALQAAVARRRHRLGGGPEFRQEHG